MKEKLVGNMKESPFSIILDASNDTGLYKIFPVTVCVFDINHRRVMPKLLDMNMLVGRTTSTAQFEFDNVDQVLEKYGLDWNLVWFGIGQYQLKHSETQYNKAEGYGYRSIAPS